MKSKKLFLPLMVILSAVLAMVIYSIVTNIAKKPDITETDFPFFITYEFNGETVTIEDVYSAHFAGNAGYIDATNRIYKGRIVGKEDSETSYILYEDEKSSIVLYTNLYADYLMGDAGYDYFLYDDFAPRIVYYDEQSEHTDRQTLQALGVKLVSWQYPKPIENSFSFSHIAHLNSEAVVPLAVIATVAFIIILIFVKKEKDFIRKPVDTVSVLLNFAIALVVVPFTTMYGLLSDITGSSPHFIYQLGYVVPAVTILGLASSVALRRKCFGKSGLIIQLTGPALFAVIMAFMLA